MQKWVSAWRNEKVVDLEYARVFVIGGGEPGMTGIGGMGGSLYDEKLPERGGFWMSERVIQGLDTG